MAGVNSAVTNVDLISPAKSQHENSDTSEISGITEAADTKHVPVNSVDVAETTATADIVDSLAKIEDRDPARVADTSAALDTVVTSFTSDTAAIEVETPATVAINNDNAIVVENFLSQVDTEIEVKTSAHPKPITSEMIESGTDAVQLADYRNSPSGSVSEHESGNEPHMGSESSLENYNDDNRRGTPRREPDDDATSTDGDNDKDANYDVDGEVDVEEEQQVVRKESPQPPRKVDDDEDKNNPQYIPKRGTFYEHDYRTTEDLPDEEKPDTEKEKADGAVDGKKKMWLEKRENWSHDKFREEDQTPKSRDELIAIYGYDIRNEDGPPRARRRRRYGRGPNKYTRNWEDEDAYYKSSVKKQPRELVEPTVATNRDTPRVAPTKHEQQDGGAARAGPIRSQQNTAGTGRIVWPNRDYAASDYKSFTKARNFNRSGEYTAPQRSAHDTANRQQQRQHAPMGGRYEDNNTRDVVNQIDMGLSSLSMHDSPAPPERKLVSKRYSAIRQRTLPETPTKITTVREAMEAHHKANTDVEHRGAVIGNVLPSHHYFEDSNYSNAQQQAVAPPPPQQMNVAMCPPPPQLAMPPMADTAQLAQLQQQRFVGGVGVGPPLAPAAPPQFGLSPPQFMARPPQPPPLNINYQLAPQHYYPHQQAPPPPQFVPQVATDQLFQPQGGITYYSPEEQQTTQRHAPPARPKVAIPILPPPPTPPPINSDIIS